MATIDSTQCMRDIVLGDPMFGEFLVDKGFPFSVDNPITEFVTFDDVVRMRELDREAFLAEYDEYRARGGVLPKGAQRMNPAAC
ncbi:hypothetical protein K6V98_07895 [Collinsella sp. AGMB00827]|uniref:Nitrate ABC transporter ATPase n=1 Tax=Collinsella ureilytica TaxID=2869515 RepID=A0ABS7MLL9_9ACTN|nr:hypothetical protein [Collinsella urealyticum]MBY4798266.1 hypothetical protein [Collinsella urealyticum]